MGIPTIPNYIITSSLAGPALLELGVPLLVSHMFVFYFGIMADLTPPVALAAFAAAPMAKISGMKIAHPGDEARRRRLRRAVHGRLHAGADAAGRRADGGEPSAIRSRSSTSSSRPASASACGARPWSASCSPAWPSGSGWSPSPPAFSLVLALPYTDETRLRARGGRRSACTGGGRERGTCRRSVREPLHPRRRQDDRAGRRPPSRCPGPTRSKRPAGRRTGASRPPASRSSRRASKDPAPAWSRRRTQCLKDGWWVYAPKVPAAAGNRARRLRRDRRRLVALRGGQTASKSARRPASRCGSSRAPGSRLQPAAIAHDQAGERQRDFNVEAEPAVGSPIALDGFALRHQRARQRNAKRHASFRRARATRPSLGGEPQREGERPETFAKHTWPVIRFSRQMRDEGFCAEASRPAFRREAVFCLVTLDGDRRARQAGKPNSAPIRRAGKTQRRVPPRPRRRNDRCRGFRRAGARPAEAPRNPRPARAPAAAAPAVRCAPNRMRNGDSPASISLKRQQPDARARARPSSRTAVEQLLERQQQAPASAGPPVRRRPRRSASSAARPPAPAPSRPTGVARPCRRGRSRNRSSRSAIHLSDRRERVRSSATRPSRTGQASSHRPRCRTFSSSPAWNSTGACVVALGKEHEVGRADRARQPALSSGATPSASSVKSLADRPMPVVLDPVCRRARC